MPVSFAQLRQASPGADTRRAWWHLLSAGTVWRDESERHPGADKAGLHIFRVTRGRGWLVTPRGRAELRPGACCWLVDLGQPRTYETMPGTRLVTQGFRINGPLLRAWLDLLGGSGEVALTPEASARLRASYRELLKLVADASRQAEWRIHGVLTEVWGQLFVARDFFRQNAPPPPEPVRRVLDAVLARPSHAWRARDLAAVAQTSYSSLRAIFRATRGETLHQFLQKVRLDEVHKLLADQRLSLKEVAARLDFRSESYFTHWLRCHTGQSPTACRKLQRG